MSRPKGIIQQRNDSKYWLPVNVVLKDNQSSIYNKDTKLIFIDNEFGEFISSFKAIQKANASTHPLAISKRRAETNYKKYGVSNPAAHPDIRKKASDTMEKRYGVRNALQSPLFLNKSKETLKKNYGVTTPMLSDEIKQKHINKLMNKYGVDNIAKLPEFIEKAKKTSLVKYGVDNPSKSSKIKEKIIESRINNSIIGVSKMETELTQYIQSLGLETKKSYIGGENPREIDILIQNLNIAIEFNGAYYHSEANINMYNNYHYDKMKACEKKGLRLIQIFDFEWETRKSQVKSFLRANLGRNNRRINARECKIKEVDQATTNDFLNKYHILGTVRHNVSYGIYYKEELLSLITFGKHHRGKKVLVLSRYCGKENVSVIGGLSKLCKFAYKSLGEFITWIDLRFSNGKNWLNNGWILDGVLRPDYFYFNASNGKIVSKQTRKKKLVNTPINMTEHAHALSEGLYRIYDCGKLRLRYGI